MSKKKPAARKTKTASANAIDVIDIDVHEMIEKEAYLLAEKRGFNGGDPVQDWLQAEKKVDEMLNI